MLISSINTPWKIVNALISWLSYPFVKISFILNGIPWGKGWKFHGVPILQKHRLSVMCFGDGMELRSLVRSNPLGTNHPVILCTWQAGALLEIGKNFAMTGGSIVVAQKIIIGNNVNIGSNSTIVDTDFHPTGTDMRINYPQEANKAPTIIGDNVFIGMNCIILKGVTLGAGCVIGAGSVVTKSIPPGVIAAGNPAKVIRILSE